MKPRISLAWMLGALFIWACAGAPELVQLQEETQAAGNKVKLVDSNGDGNFDAIDTDGDGKPDAQLMDKDGDGVFDSLDTNNDGRADQDLGDTDGDGDMDGVDVNNDGVPDVSIVDTNDDNNPDDVVTHGPDLTICHEQSDRHVLVCHVPPGNPDQEHEICIGAPAVNAHLRKGSYLGACRSSTAIRQSR